LPTFVAVTVPLLVALSACSDDSGENAGAAGTASVDDSMSDSSPETSGTLVEASEPASTGASTTSTTMPAAGPEGGAADGCGAEAEDVTFEQPVPSEASPEMTAAIELARAQPAFDPAAVGPEAIDAVIAEQRRLFDLTGQLVPVESDVVVTAISDAPVPARWFVAPGVDEQRVVVYVHGGGLVAGSAESHGGVAARLSAAARARVLFVEYQRAPEAAFPSQVDQVVAAYRWLLDHDIDPSCVSIAGDSVGGVAVLSATVALRGLGVPLPAGLALLSPVTDQTNSGPSRRTNAATDPVVTGELTGVLTLLSLQGFDAASPGSTSRSVSTRARSTCGRRQRQTRPSPHKRSTKWAAGSPPRRRADRGVRAPNGIGPRALRAAGFFEPGSPGRTPSTLVLIP
jgi:hypothetical protein